MTVQLVLDSSVACKWFLTVGEDGIDQAETLLSAQLSGEVALAAPASLPLEVANAAQSSRLLEAAVLDAIDYLDAAHVELFETTLTRLQAATKLAYRHGVTVYDALFLQLAEELRCPLVTADRRAFAGVYADVEIRLL